MVFAAITVASDTGVDDELDDGNEAFNIVTGLATSDDTDYSGLKPGDVAETNDDDGTTPVASDGNLSTAEDKAKSGTMSVTEGDVDSYTVAIVTGPSNGAVQITNEGLRPKRASEQMANRLTINVV